MNAPTTRASTTPDQHDAVALCESVWLAALAARGIVCDEARVQRIALASPYLERIKRRLREWRAIGEGFDARIDVENGRDR
jgi:hypothetical protein